VELESPHPNPPPVGEGQEVSPGMRASKTNRHLWMKRTSEPRTVRLFLTTGPQCSRLEAIHCCVIDAASADVDAWMVS
jgi:hypothetical protein